MSIHRVKDASGGEQSWNSWLAPCAVAAVLCWALSPRLVIAEPFRVKNYLLAGNAEYLSGANFDRTPGKVTQFLVSITGERALVGWSFDHDETGEHFRFIGETIDNPIGFRFLSTLGRNMLDSTDRSLGYVARQRETVESDYHSRIAAVQMAAFAKYPFALFFSSDYVGVRYDDVAALLEQGEGSSSSQFPAGWLTVVKKDGLQSIAFSQGVNDLLTPRAPGRKLTDVVSEPFESGLKRILYTCAFDPPLTAESSAPWVSDCVIEKEGQDGHLVRAEFRITVDVYSKDESRINREIDKVLGQIPEGERISTNEPIDYVWKDQKIVRKIDAAALGLAEDRKLQSGRQNAIWRTLFVVNFIVLSLFAIFLLVRKRTRNK